MDGKNVDEQCAALESVEGEGGEDLLGENYGGAEENDLRVFFAEVMCDPSGGAIRSEIFGCCLFGGARETKSEVSLRLSLQSGSRKASTNGFHCLCLLNGEEEKRRGKRRVERVREIGERRETASVL